MHERDSSETKMVFSGGTQSGKRSYLFEVRETRAGARYLVIGESKHSSGKVALQGRVMVFQNDLAAFFQALQKATAAFPKKHRPKTYTLPEVRAKYPKAYERWTSEEDVRLAAAYGKGKTVAELAREFGRKPGAITSRLTKLVFGVK